LRTTQIGDETGVILPMEIRDELGVEPGDSVFLTRLPDGAFRLTRYDPEFAATIENARDFMRRHHEAFKKLAE